MTEASKPIGSQEEPQSSTATSRSLLDRLKAGDPEAWDRLVVLYAPLVYRWCRRWDLRDQDIADILQDVFQAVATHIAAFRKEQAGDTFRGWLRTIAHSKVQDHFRRTGREPGGVGGTDAQIRLASLPAARAVDDDDPHDATAERLLLSRGLDLIRDEFEDRTWKAFWSTAVEGRDTKDVALELGMTPGAVRVAKSRVLHRLRAELGESP
ncbi:MAG TPA: sigma-70 family RNA polymerase sigma factor [Isosphaeraceae bacterium]|nr:sigma-70 family RNA polymerase sigma factor [Isosphaeraceae bacterium]